MWGYGIMKWSSRGVVPHRRTTIRTRCAKINTTYFSGADRNALTTCPRTYLNPAPCSNPTPPSSPATSRISTPTTHDLYIRIGGDQNSQGLVQPFLISLLNEPGRELISSIIRQGSTLYPPGARTLKDVVSNYLSLTGSHKWLFASIILLVFRPVLRSTHSLVR